ncbi:MAG: DUF6485 family protein [archaeon]
MECNKKRNLNENCNCSYPGCPRKGVCCECIAYHVKSNALPACYFSKEGEAKYDRSLKAFLKDKGF